MTPGASSRCRGASARARRGPLPIAKSIPLPGSSQTAVGRKAALVPSGHCGLHRPRLLACNRSQARRSPLARTAQSRPFCGSRCKAWTSLAALPGGRGASKTGMTLAEAAGRPPCPSSNGKAATGRNSPSQPTVTRHHSAVPSSSSSNMLVTRAQGMIAPVSSLQGPPGIGTVHRGASSTSALAKPAPNGQIPSLSGMAAASRHDVGEDGNDEFVPAPAASAVHITTALCGVRSRASSSICSRGSPELAFVR
mmetsp:Transcript_10642/g.33555  ORF Transcript_10642/g.33555 Transcript_10642/m.33555 type:complete len:252 (+) Transcript_10642:185-940(+)